MKIQTRFRKEKTIRLLPTINIVLLENGLPIDFAIEFYWIIWGAGFRFYK
jgi:hypothetical protein